MSLFSKIHGGEKAMTPLNVLTAERFFTENNPNGYCSKPQFLKYLESLNQKAMDEMELFLDYLSQRKALNSLPILKKDRSGEPYIWCGFKMPNSDQGFKVMTSLEGIAKFIRDYQAGAFHPMFSLDALWNEAKKEEKA